MKKFIGVPVLWLDITKKKSPAALIYHVRMYFYQDL
jgi:hypothetical protein